MPALLVPPPVFRVFHSGILPAIPARLIPWLTIFDNISAHLMTFTDIYSTPPCLHIFHCLCQISVSSWSFRPARYVLVHSHPPHTRKTSNGISSAFRLTWYPSHSTLHCLFLPSRFWAFSSPFQTLKSLTWRPDIFPSTHWFQWVRREL